MSWELLPLFFFKNGHKGEKKDSNMKKRKL